MTILNSDLYYLTLSTCSTGICLNILKDDCLSIVVDTSIVIGTAFILIMNLLCPLLQFTLWRDCISEQIAGTTMNLSV